MYIYVQIIRSQTQLFAFCSKTEKNIDPLEYPYVRP